MSESLELFENVGTKREVAPLAERLRPATLDGFVGQEDLLGPGRPLRKLIEDDHVPSMILWGPPGSGKTTLAHIIATRTKAHFHSLSAVLSGVKELRHAVDVAKQDLLLHQRRTILFVDEIHRFNKAQQDALLPHVEEGTITLVGATTENPSFEVIGPLLSRSRVFVLKPLSGDDLKILLDRGCKELGVVLDDEAREFVLEVSSGDARQLYNILEVAASLTPPTPSYTKRGNESIPTIKLRGGQGGLLINLKTVAAAAQKKTLVYDKGGEEHYNVISAFIKSMRASDPDAAIYYLARMYEAGEEPRFIARRMVIFASEDIGLADPQALPLAVSAFQAYEVVGEAEGWIPLAEAAIYLACAKKGNDSYMAYKNAKEEIEKSGPLPVPLHLKNAPTPLMKKLGYGQGYRYPHTDPEGAKKLFYLPEKIRGLKFFKLLRDWR